MSGVDVEMLRATRKCVSTAGTLIEDGVCETRCTRFGGVMAVHNYSDDFEVCKYFALWVSLWYYVAIMDGVFTDKCMEYARQLLEKCRACGVRLGTAESCTGGLVSGILSAIPGASDVFEGTVVAYQNRIKEKLLNVSAKTLATMGAVSAECAEEMAQGVCNLLGVPLGIAVTGIAGPGGATPEKPVGRVYIAVAYRGIVAVKEHTFDGTRAAVRAATVEHALRLAHACLEKETEKMVDIDWKNLGFSYMPTRSHIRYTWKNGAWDGGELVNEPMIKMSIAAGCLHYGQECFEGMKVFRQQDGKIVAFRPQANAARMQRTAYKTVMPPVPTEMFLDALKRVVRDNIDYVPPYGCGASMYVRPLLIGTGPQIGVAPANEYTFIMMVMPMGNYYKGGIKPVRAIIFDEYDRAAPQGMGDVKVGGNYAASLFAHEKAHEMGFPVELYLDAKTHTCVEEFATSNFIGFKADGTFVTVKSSSVLPSVTNLSLQQLAADLGHPVEIRQIPYEELREFTEIGACGTAVVVTPVCEVHRNGEVIEIGSKTDCGPNLRKLHDMMQDIQFGRIPDEHGWCYEL